MKDKDLRERVDAHIASGMIPCYSSPAQHLTDKWCPECKSEMPMVVIHRHCVCDGLPLAVVIDMLPFAYGIQYRCMGCLEIFQYPTTPKHTCLEEVK